MAGVTENGFVVKNEAEITADLNASFLAAFGAQFAVDPNLPDGQLIGVFARTLADAWLQQEAAYNAYSPSNAFDVGLDKLVELNSIQRIIDEPTKVAMSLTGTAGAVVPVGYIIKTDDGLEFSTVAQAVLPASVTARCTTLGAIKIGANEVHVLSTPVPAGLTGATNPEAGVTGIVREEDPALRQRRSKATISSGTSALDAIYEAVEALRLPYINILENDTNATVNGIPPFSFLTVVEGGTPEEISKVIFDNKPMNIKSFGAITTQVADRKGRLHPIGISRPTVVYIDVTVHIIKLPGASVTADAQMQAGLVDFINDTQIAQDVYWSDLFDPALKAAPNTKIKSLLIRKGTDAYATNDIIITDQERALTTLARVVVIVD
jgi:uncharacterized phage protein gp47/JayE